jgi:lysine 2,3-aminomutase
MDFPLPLNRRKPSARFPIAAETGAFRRRFFPGASASEWNDWRWQTRNRVRGLAALGRILNLSEDETGAIARHSGSLPLAITPYYLSLMGRDDPREPLRRTHVPVNAEYVKSPGEDNDPLGEDKHSPVPGLVHRYPDRALFLTTGFCASYCRYCTRSRLVGDPDGELSPGRAQWQRALDYLSAHPEVRDVLISGGDPLTLADEKLDWLLARLREIPHVEFIRLGTKAPIVLPQRATRALMKVLRKHRPVWISLHAIHPKELTPEVKEATSRLADAGAILGGQTVLLKGVNDDVATMRALMRGLLRFRVKPYYLLQCDPITGSAHFRTAVEKGVEIIEGLRGHTTGYAVPHFMLDAPGGGGKIPLVPEYLLGREGDDVVFRNFEGKLYRYADPGGRLGAKD